MKIKNYISEILLLIGVCSLLLYSTSPIEKGDSLRYLSGSLLDPPMYSTIIRISEFLFGSLKPVVMFQTLMIGLGIFYFTKTMSKIFNLNNIIKFLVSFFLFIPILQFYNYLLTEPLGYALSLLFVTFNIRLIYKFKIKNLIISVFFAITLLLTRNQFMFIYPIIFFLFIGLFILNNYNKKLIKFLMLAFITTFILHNSIILLNTYINKDSFDKNYVAAHSIEWKESLTYVSLGPNYYFFFDAIYISKKEDANLFVDQNIKETLTKIFDEMNERKSLIEYYDGRGHFSKSFSDIRDFSNPLLLELADKNKISLSKLKRKIYIKLISANFKKYLKQIFKKFYDTTWLFIFVPVIMLITSLISFFKNKSKVSLIVFFVSIFSLSNHSVIYFFGRVQPRYFIYTDFILLMFIFILFSIFFFQKNNKTFH